MEEISELDSTDLALLAQLQDVLQGLVWRDGYARGDFRGHVYPDAAMALSASAYSSRDCSASRTCP